MTAREGHEQTLLKSRNERLTSCARWGVSLSTTQERRRDFDPVFESFRCQLELGETFRRRHIPHDLEPLLLRERFKSGHHTFRIMLGYKTEEERNVERTHEVDVVHMLGEIRRNVDETEKLDFFAHGLQALDYLKRHQTTVAVASDGIWSRWLDPPYTCGIRGNHLVHGREEGLTRLEATSTESIEWTLILKVLGKIEENKNLSDSRVHEEEGCLVSGHLEGNSGVVFLSLTVFGEQGVDIVG